MGATLRRGLCLYDRAGRRQPDERPRDAATGSCDGKPSQGRPHPDGAGGCWLLNPLRPVAAVRRAAIRPRRAGGPALVVWRGGQLLGQSEERRVGKECVGTLRSRWALFTENKHIQENDA